MTQLSLGLIETVGLTTAVTAADAALKSANVELVGYELAKGGGLTTVKVRGNVGSVKAAVAAAAAAATAIGRVATVMVIARPAQDIGGMVDSKDTVGGATANVPARKEEQAVAPPAGNVPAEDAPAVNSPAVNSHGKAAPSPEDAGIPPVSEEPAEAPTAPEEPVHDLPETPEATEVPAAPKAPSVKPSAKPGTKPGKKSNR